jgi:3-oxoacyl-[acyl-carrier protein] reductase
VIETDMLGADVPLEQILEAVPMRRVGKPDEIAGVVSFLMSPDAAYITRQVISVNGGLC